MIVPQTRDQIIAAACALEPRSAMLLRASGESAQVCATPIYTNYLDDHGQVVPLNLVSGGRYAAGYVRVSTVRQRLDGWSIADQVSRIVDFCIAHGYAFRIFSDASLSGKLPTDDRHLIEAWS